MGAMRERFSQENEVRPFPLIHISRPVYIEHGYREINQFFSEERYLKDSKNENSHKVTIIVGAPGAGKTEVALRAKEYISQFIPISEIHYLSWDHAQDSARAKKLITTPEEEAYTPSELEASNLEMAQAAYMGIRYHRHTIIEIPDTGISTPEGLKGRDLGVSFLTRLATRQEPFEPLRYDLEAVSLTSGPLVRFVMVRFRDEMQRCLVDLYNGKKYEEVLSDVQEAATVFGKLVPETLDNLHELAEGGHIKRVEKISKSIAKVIKYLKKRGTMAPSYQVYRKDDPYKSQAKSTAEILHMQTNDVLQQMYNSWRSPIIWDYQFNKIFKLPDSQVFIGDNNPTLDDLHISPQVVSEYLARKKFERGE